MAIQLLEEIEKLSGKPIRQTFDYICGVSTGALLATMLSVHSVPLKDCADMYKVSEQTKLLNVSKTSNTDGNERHFQNSILDQKLALTEFFSILKQFSKDMFSRSRWVGASKLVMSHGYYDHTIWEKILQ